MIFESLLSSRIQRAENWTSLTQDFPIQVSYPSGRQPKDLNLGILIPNSALSQVAPGTIRAKFVKNNRWEEGVEIEEYNVPLYWLFSL